MNKAQSVLFSAGVLLALAFAFGCSGGDDGGGSIDYGGETYKTVVIGTQTWMARNLNYVVDGGKCYGEGVRIYDSENDKEIILSNAEIKANCAKYGRLYNWAAAMALPSDCNLKSCASQISVRHQGICPPGWHIPSNAEWTTLKDYVGTNAGTKLKARDGWNAYSGVPLGSDTYGFSALPGGSGHHDGSFSSVGGYGFFWSASENNINGSYAYESYLGYDSQLVHNDHCSKILLLSVRCVQD